MGSAVVQWQYRVMRREEACGSVSFAIYEVCLVDGVIVGWSPEPVRPYGANPRDLQADLFRMLAAYGEAVLDHRSGTRIRVPRRKRDPEGSR